MPVEQLNTTTNPLLNKVGRPKKKKAPLYFGLAALAIVILLCIILFFYTLGSAPTTLSSGSDEAYEQRPAYRYVIGKDEKGVDMVCNDGTETVYHMRFADPPTNKWVFRLEGGASCTSQVTCDNRMEKRPQDMTTELEEELWLDEDGGLLCDDPELNPDFWDYNAIQVHYCTSDSHLGTCYFSEDGCEENETTYAFDGGRSLFTMLAQLIADYGMGDAELIVSTGMSVGGTGMLNLVDHLEEYYQTYVPEAQTFFMADSGWQLLNFTQSEWNHTVEGFKVHQPIMNQNCLDEGFTWQCYYTSDYLATRIDNWGKTFVSQQQFDKMYLAYPFGDPYDYWTDEQWDYAWARAEALDATWPYWPGSYFSSNCRAHDSYDKPDFTRMEVADLDGVSWSESSAVAHLIANPGTILRMEDMDFNPEHNPTCVYDWLEWCSMEVDDYDCDYVTMLGCCNDKPLNPDDCDCGCCDDEYCETHDNVCPIE